MENEAKILEKAGDSQMTAESEQIATVAETENSEVECANGVCVLNWKPARTAA